MRAAHACCVVRSGRWALDLAAVFTFTLLAACASTKKLDKPVPLQVTGVVASAADERVGASIDTVIVRGGPGAWAKDAFWDEYLIRIQLKSDRSTEVTRIVVVDSLGERHRPRTTLGDLEKESKQVAHRYKDAHVPVTAGIGGGALFATGYVVGGTSALAGLASAGTGAAAGVAVAGALVVAPVLMTVGLVGMVEESRVQREIDRRSVDFPVALPPNQEQSFHVFFPLAPAPRRVEVKYVDAQGPHVLVIDTQAALPSLHLAQPTPTQPADEQQPQ